MQTRSFLQVFLFFFREWLRLSCWTATRSCNGFGQELQLVVLSTRNRACTRDRSIMRVRSICKDELRRNASISQLTTYFFCFFLIKKYLALQQLGVQRGQ